MLNHLRNHFNETTTENGAFAYKSTNSSVLDLFSQGGAMRNNSESQIKSLFSKAFNENPTLALKTLFYLRDIKQGQGERNLFKVSLKHLAVHSKESLIKNIHLVSEFGRWDDLLVLLDTDVKKEVLSFIEFNLKKDMVSKNPSLLAKWLPSENASSHETKKNAKIIRKSLGMTPREYRVTLSSLRKKINLVETNLTQKNYEDIDYSKVPSKAGMQYRTAFFRNDEERYKEFLDSLEKGEVKVNSGALYPNDIVGKILGGNSWYTPAISPQDTKLFEGQWNNLPDFIGEKKEDSLVMADVSGSMSGVPMSVSIALAMYIAERNEGIFKNHFMTFSERPELVKIQGKNIVDKVQNISRAGWGYNTNIEKALKTILDIAVKNNVSKDDIVKKLYIISDMQFDMAVNGGSIFGNMEKEFNRHGYDLPNIVFWNVASHQNTPVKMNKHGVQLVSGFSPSILKQLLNADGKTPYEMMLEVVTSERYEEVSA